MKKVISLLLITCLLCISCAGAEGLLPSLSETVDIGMPSLSEALNLYPDSEVENEDGSITEFYTGITEDDFNLFSAYLKESQANLIDYKTENGIITASIQFDGSSFSFKYNLSSGEAEVNYPQHTFNRRTRLAKEHYLQMVQFAEAGEKEKARDEYYEIPMMFAYKPASDYLEKNIHFAHDSQIVPDSVFGEYEYYISEDGSAIISHYNGEEKSLTLPSEINGIPVTALKNLGWVYRVEEVFIPDSITIIYDNPFNSFQDLKTITVSPDHPTLKSIDGILFSKDENRLICYPRENKKKSYTVPEDVKIIGKNAFYFQLHLSSITLPKSLTTIEDSAFVGCHVKSFTIPEGVVSIGDGAFGYIDELENIILPETLIHIGDQAFQDCTGLKSITIPKGVSDMGKGVFEKSSITNIAISADNPYLAIIDGVLFSKPDKRLICYPKTFTNKEYSIPQGIQIIGAGAFMDCKSLEKVVIPDSVKHIEEEAFSGCSNYNSFDLPTSIITIGDEAFYYCTSFSSVVIPEGVTTIGEFAFSGCSMETITLPNSVCEFGGNPFTSCAKLTRFIISEDHPYLTVVDDALIRKTDMRLISYPHGLDTEAYSVPSGVRIIGKYAFLRNPKMKRIIIPESVDIICEQAFYSVDNLNSVELHEGLVAIGNSSFSWCRKLKEINVPEGVVFLGNNTFYNCEGLSRLSIPGSVIFIGSAAIKSCDESLVVTVQKDSYAMQYCSENGINCTYTGANDWLNN